MKYIEVVLPKLQSMKKIVKCFFDNNTAVTIFRENTLLDCNRLAVKLFGYSNSAEFISAHPSELSPEYQPDGELSYIKAEHYLEQAAKLGFVEFKWVHKNTRTNALVWVKISLQSFYYKDCQHVLAQLIPCSKGEYDFDGGGWGNSHFLLLNEHKRAVDASSIVSKADRKGRITYINRNFCQVSGFSPKELLGKNHNIVRHPNMSDAFFKSMWRELKLGNVWRGVIKNRKKTGETYYVDSTITPLKDASGKIVEFIAIRNDITELIKQKLLIERQNTDRVTGLPNKVKLLNDLEEKEYRYIAMIQIEQIEDLQLVYSNGDYENLLRLITQSIQSYLLDSDSMYRYGDQQFVVASTMTQLHGFTSHINTVIANFDKKQIRFGLDSLFINLIAGIAVTKSSCLLEASIALTYTSRSNTQVSVYTESTNIQRQVKSIHCWANRIRHALHSDGIVPFGQLIVDKDQRYVYTEVLMRLVSAGEYVSPFHFLDVAVQTKLYPSLTMEIIKKSFAFFSDSNRNFSINLTQTDIANPVVIGRLFDAIENSKFMGTLTVELVESERLAFDDNELNDVINRLKVLGCKIAIDDFGSGYSNFSYLAQLPIDVVKIDGSLIKNLQRNRCIVQSICDFCHNLEIKVVAEYVETEAIFLELKALGVDYFQGYYFDKPTLLFDKL